MADIVSSSFMKGDDYTVPILTALSAVLSILIGYVGLCWSFMEEPETPAVAAAADVTTTTAAGAGAAAAGAAKVTTEDTPNTPVTCMEYMEVFIGLLDTISSREYILNYSCEDDQEAHILAYDQALRYLYTFMKTNGHPNTEDLNHVCNILSQEEHPDAERALQWLLVARCVWRASPYMVMLPWASSQKDQQIPRPHET